MERFRFILVVLIGAFITSSAHAQIRYSVTDLGANFTPSAINEQGTVGGYVRNSSNNSAYLYQNENIIDFRGLGKITSISAANVAVLSGTQSGLVTNGVFTASDDSYVPYFINASGQMLESAASGLYLNTSGVRQFVAPANYYPIALNNSGQALLATASIQSCIWQNGQLTNLTTPGGWVIALNDSGHYIQQIGNISGFLYTGSETASLAFCPLGLNNSDTVVGTKLAPVSSAVIYQLGQLIDLNTLIDPASGWILNKACVINDNGWIAGQGINPQGQFSAFLLKPVPEPATLSLLALSLLAARKRKTA